MAKFQIPGGPYVIETGSAKYQIPGGPFINEKVVASGGGNTVVPSTGHVVITGYAPTVSNGALEEPDGPKHRIVIKIKNTTHKTLSQEVEGFLRAFVAKSEAKGRPLPPVRVSSELKQTSSRREFELALRDLQKVRLLLAQLQIPLLPAPEPILLPSLEDLALGQQAFIQEQNAIAVRLLVGFYEANY